MCKVERQCNITKERPRSEESILKIIIYLWSMVVRIMSSQKASTEESGQKLLQNEKSCILRKWDNFTVTKWDDYYKAGQLLQSDPQHMLLMLLKEHVIKSCYLNVPFKRKMCLIYLKNKCHSW